VCQPIFSTLKKTNEKTNGLNLFVLDRANPGAEIFRKQGDFVAFEKVLHEALQLYQIMDTHWHLVLRPLVDGGVGRFCKWVVGTHSMRYNAHHHLTGTGHLHQGRFKSFPIQDDEYFFVVCRYFERNALRAGIVSREEDWRWGSLWRRLQSPMPEPKPLSPWPIARLPNCVQRVNELLSDSELKAVRNCARRGAPLGDEGLIESIARRLDIESRM
jgi:putative transposase